MIVKNEEKYLDRCINSIQGKVDEIIVVDTGSTDRTIEIAQKYNSVVKYFEWINDFAAARNYSISDAKMEYILVLDADEYLDDSADLQKDLERGESYYSLQIRNYQNEGKSFVHQSIRLFKSGIGLRYKGKLHEHLNTDDKDSNYKGAKSDIVINHVGYLTEVVSERDKIKRNYDIMVRELEENPTGYNYFNMGMVYMNEKQYDKALNMYKKSYSIDKHRTYIKGMLIRMGECLMFLDRTEEGIKLLTDVANAFPNYTEFHYTLGVLFQNIGYLRDAEIEFLECLKLGKNVENIFREGVGSYLADYQLALIYDKKGRYREAFDEVFKSVIGNRSFYPALALYLKLLQRSDISLEEMQKHLEIVYPIGSIKDLSNLVSALYKIRHQLISKYDWSFRDENNTYLRAVAYMLDGNYMRSLEEWKKVVSISSENLKDVLALSLITGDMSLIEKVRDSSNLGEKEWRYLIKILSAEEISNNYNTPEVEKLLLDIAYYLLDIKAFDQFEYISKFIIECSIETQNKLVVSLISTNHMDTALELLSLNLERYPENYEVPLLAGDIFSINNDFTTALDFYYRSLKLIDHYPTYERIYEIYEKMGIKKELNELSIMMKEKFPLSLWLKKV